MLLYNFLTYSHMAFIAIALVMFIVRFYWLKTQHAHFQHRFFTKLHWHSHYALFAVGVILMFYLGFNPFNEAGYWLLEKCFAFAAYLFMVSSALNPNKRARVQWLTFFGAFGWLAYMGKLAMSKQAILLLG